MKIVIELDADELKQFAELPERISNLSFIVQAMDDRVYNMAKMLETVSGKFEMSIRNHIGG
jgi:hypothetical protein